MRSNSNPDAGAARNGLLLLDDGSVSRGRLLGPLQEVALGALCVGVEHSVEAGLGVEIVVVTGPRCAVHRDGCVVHREEIVGAELDRSNVGLPIQGDGQDKISKHVSGVGLQRVRLGHRCDPIGLAQKPAFDEFGLRRWPGPVAGSAALTGPLAVVTV